MRTKPKHKNKIAHHHHINPNQQKRPLASVIIFLISYMCTQYMQQATLENVLALMVYGRRMRMAKEKRNAN